ncbi:MAG: DUF1573 domain-containing protein [Planctomycetota bacterium]|nr:DUF1573 domain-containing protein [Planctomycetota bacterium]
MTKGMPESRMTHRPRAGLLRLPAILLAASLLALPGCGETGPSPSPAESAEENPASTAAPAPDTQNPNSTPPAATGSPAPAESQTDPPGPVPPDASLEGPSVRFDTTRHDFGRIWDVGDHAVAFEFTNTGDAPLHFRRITSSCACTLASLDRWRYAPGESGAISTTLEPTKAGPQTQTITILTNDPTRPVIKLNIVANVRQFITFDRKFARFGEVERYREHTRQFTLLCAGEEMSIENIESSHPDVSTEILSTDPEAGRAVIEVTLHDDAPWGIIRNAKIDCTVSGRLPDGRRAEKTSTIRAIGTVLDEIHADLYSMSVGLVPPGGRFEAGATVYHAADEPFELVEASIVEAKNATMDVTFAEDNRSIVGGYRLTVRGRASNADDELILGFIEFLVTTRTDPLGSPRRIPIIGKISARR